MTNSKELTKAQARTLNLLRTVGTCTTTSSTVSPASKSDTKGLRSPTLWALSDLGLVDVARTETTEMVTVGPSRKYPRRCTFQNTTWTQTYTAK